MLEKLIQASKMDAGLAALLDEVREFTQIYLLAKQRHKGCAGTGEFMTLREDYKDVLAKLKRYCEQKGYPCIIDADDPDTMTKEML